MKENNLLNLRLQKLDVLWDLYSKDPNHMVNLNDETSELVYSLASFLIQRECGVEGPIQFVDYKSRVLQRATTLSEYVLGKRDLPIKSWREAMADFIATQRNNRGDVVRYRVGTSDMKSPFMSTDNFSDK